jgi:hypothetical protein
VAAGDQPREGKVVLGAPMLLGMPAVEHALHPLPQLPRSERLVPPLVEVAVPLELPSTESIAKDGVDRANRHLRAAPAMDEFRRARLLRRLLQG